MLKEYLKSTRASLKYSFRYATMLSITLIVLSILLSLTPYLNSYGLKILLNSLEGMAKDQLVFNRIISIIVFFSILITIPEILKIVHELINKLWTFKISEKIEALVLQKKIDIEIHYHESSDFQNLMQRAFHRGIYPLLDLTRLHFSMIRYGVSFILGSVLACNLSLVAYILLIISCTPQLYVQYKYGHGIWHIRAEDSPEQRRFMDLKRYFTTAEVIIETKLFQTGSKLIKWAQDILRRFHQKHSRFEKKRVARSLMAEAIFFLGSSVCFYLLLERYADGEWKLGDLVFAIGTFIGAGSSIRDLFLIINHQYEEHLSVKDILEFFDTPISTSNDNGKNVFRLESSPEVIFEKVWFKYASSDDWVLKGVSFKLEKNRITALIGANGSGKSTIIKLLCKIYEPTKGKIYINGEELNKIDVENWRSEVAVLLQDSIDYYFPAKEAISVGNFKKPLDIDRVLESAYLSRASEFIEKWKEKYETPLGLVFDGKAPSKGQRQKLSLAKTIYRDSFLTIFDEPTTSMDIGSVKFIANKLKKIGEGKSLIIISHDTVITKKCDDIVLIKKGTVSIHGSHKDLFQNEDYKKIMVGDK